MPSSSARSSGNVGSVRHSSGVRRRAGSAAGMDDPLRETWTSIHPGGFCAIRLTADSSSNRPREQLEGYVGPPFGHPWYNIDERHRDAYGQDDPAGGRTSETVPNDLQVRDYAQALIRRAFARGLRGQGQHVPPSQRRRQARRTVDDALRTYVRRRYGTASRAGQGRVGRNRRSTRRPASRPSTRRPARRRGGRPARASGRARP